MGFIWKTYFEVHSRLSIVIIGGCTEKVYESQYLDKVLFVFSKSFELQLHVCVWVPWNKFHQEIYIEGRSLFFSFNNKEWPSEWSLPLVEHPKLQGL